jgi:hypothetical protein
LTDDRLVGVGSLAAFGNRHLMFVSSFFCFFYLTIIGVRKSSCLDYLSFTVASQNDFAHRMRCAATAVEFAFLLALRISLSIISFCT